MPYKMTYTKPSNVRYVDMCKYFDEHVYEKDRDDNKLFQYLYHICYMLACKHKFFKTFNEYDDFALYASTCIYMRIFTNITKGSQQRINSILNYVKATLYPLKVNYQRETFNVILDSKLDPRIDSEKLREGLATSIQSDYNYGLSDDIKYRLQDICEIIKDTINESPYAEDELMKNRLYISCLISITKSITLSNHNKRKLMNKINKNNYSKDEFLIDLYEQEKATSVTLWHLPESLRDYVDILIKQINKKVYCDIMEIRASYELQEDDINSIILSSYNGGNSKDSMQED